MIAMLKMFAPSASTPPSANRKHCTINTVVSTTIAALGPSKAAASTPPTRCPEVPPATGKLTICAANRNAAASPSNGTRRGGSRRRTWRNASPTPAAESRAVVAAVFPSMNPSGMCMIVRTTTLPVPARRFNCPLRGPGAPLNRPLPARWPLEHHGALACGKRGASVGLRCWRRVVPYEFHTSSIQTPYKLHTNSGILALDYGGGFGGLAVSQLILCVVLTTLAGPLFKSDRGSPLIPSRRHSNLAGFQTT